VLESVERQKPKSSIGGGLEQLLGVLLGGGRFGPGSHGVTGRR
jgi:hypothetical protein